MGLRWQNLSSFDNGKEVKSIRMWMDNLDLEGLDCMQYIFFFLLKNAYKIASNLDMSFCIRKLLCRINRRLHNITLWLSFMWSTRHAKCGCIHIQKNTITRKSIAVI